MAAREIKNYVARARQQPTTENIEALWRTVFYLKGWYFLPSENVLGPSQPTVTLVDGEPWLLAFTNVRRLQEFARSVGRETRGKETFLLVLDPLEAMTRIRDVRHTIRGVIFNIDSEETFRAPVEALEEFARHFGLPLPDEGD